VKSHDRTLTGRGASVCDDWCAWLPNDKSKIYESHTQNLEASYTMFSVSLNEALELRRAGSVAKSHQAIFVIPGLCTRLVEPLSALLRTLAEHAKHHGIVPNAAPLDPSNYQRPRMQRTARMSALLSHVILSQRSQFLHKLSTLHEMVSDIGRDFAEAVTVLSEGPLEDPETFWQTADSCHFDLNTCLREAVVVFKSFMVAIPSPQLAWFERTYGVQLHCKLSRQESRQRLFSPRRMAPIAGE
jgi:hypothetical protein